MCDLYRALLTCDTESPLFFEGNIMGNGVKTGRTK